MPEIARFYGIVVKLYVGDHPPPHFHASYGEYAGVIDMMTLNTMEGNLPMRARKLIMEWAAIHQGELLEMWKSQQFRRLPLLE